MWKKIVISTLAVIFLSTLFLFPRVAGTETTVSVQPEGTFGLHLGDTFSIDITVSDVIDLYTWQLNLYYQSAVLNATGWVEGPFLQAPGVSTFIQTFIFTDNYNTTYGRMYIGNTRAGSVPGVNGSGVLATITFKVVGGGASVLHLDGVKLWDSAQPFGNVIPNTAVDGMAYAGLVDVAVGSIDTPPNIPAGQMAYINVTAQNRGGIPETFDVTLDYDGNPIGTQTVVNLQGGESQILNFAWQILLLPIGPYNLRATATTVPGETDTSDNTLSIMVHIGVADLAITSVTPLKTVVGQGFSAPVNVTVANQGEFSATSNVTAYANQTIIGTFENITLASGSSTTLTFTWNVTIAKGNYTISAYAWPVQFETNTSNNNLASPITVLVGMPGDVVSPFGVIDMKDIAYVAKRFGTKPGDALWDSNADFDSSGKVDMKDIAQVARNFGAHDP